MIILRRWSGLLRKEILDTPRITKVLNVVEENPEVKTINFKDDSKALPGQFMMIWIPGVDEVPMSFSYIGDDKGITVKKIGEATKVLHGLSKGEKIGIRGPYGSNFEAQGKKILAIAGGIGIAPLAPFIEMATKNKKEVVLAFGAKSSNEFLFIKRLENSCKELRLATDDGSLGYHGFVSDLADEILKKEDFDEIVTCGPELMMKKIVDLAFQKNIPIMASLERYMKCGVGICDSCAINGFLVCKDGPVFSNNALSKLKDFGEFRRDGSGRREPI